MNIPKRSSVILSAALLGAALLSTAPASSADAECTPRKATEAYQDCSGVAAFPRTAPADLLRAATPAKPPVGTLGAARPTKPRAADLTPRELDDSERLLEGSLRRFLCENNPASGDAKAKEQRVEVEYARARLFFNARRFQEAAVGFRDIAMSHPEASVAVYAMQLYLESLNVMGTQGTLGCFDAMSADVPTFIGLYCTGGKDKTNAEPCDVLTKIQRDILRLKAEQKVREADKRAGEGAYSYYEEAGAIYMKIWAEYGQPACEAKRAPCERMDEVLYNAARAYQAARNIEKATAARKILVNPRYSLNNTELAVKTVYELGGVFHALAVFDEAADWYEAFARLRPTHDKAPDALQDATILRLGLGQADAAERDASLFARFYGSKLPERTARIVFATASDALLHGDHEAAKRGLEKGMGLIDSGGAADVRVRAHAALGRALWATGKATGAAAEYGKVMALFRGASASIEKLEARDEGERLRRLGAMLTDVGEAMFFFAEQKRRAADAIKMPMYAGSGRREDILGYAQTTLVKWLPERRRAIDEAEKAYQAVLAIQPAPPPKWVVASAARVARMHGKLAAELRSAPAPKAWKQRGASPWNQSWEEVMARWNQELEEVSAPEYQKAKAAYRQCAALSVKFQYTDALSRGCWAWLSRHFRAEFPPVDELISPPSKAALGFASKPAAPDAATDEGL